MTWSMPPPPVLMHDGDAIALILVVGGEVDAGVLDGLRRGGHRQVDEAAHAACHLAVHARWSGRSP